MKTFHEFIEEKGFIIEEKHFPGKLGSGERFKACEEKMEEKGVKDPGAVCASIGRRKFGKGKFQAMAKKGKN